jgi:hypothetical protein
MPTGHKVYQGFKKKSPRIPSFDFCFFIAVIDHIANTTMYKTAKFFSINSPECVMVAIAVRHCTEAYESTYFVDSVKASIQAN